MVRAMNKMLDGIVAKFGGTRAMGRALGIDHSLISRWCKRGRVPAHRQQAVMAAARKRKLRITAGELIGCK